MQTIQQIANEKIQSMIDSGSIKTAIEDGIQKAINSAILNQFERYGTITKQIEEAIQNGLKIDTKNIDFQSYNEQMLIAVKAKIGGMFQGQASERFLSEIEKILDPAPKEISIISLVNSIVRFWKSETDYDDESCDDEASIDFKNNEHGGYSLKISKNNKSYGYKNDINIYIDDGKIRINHSHNYNPTCFSQAEAFIFKLYAAGTVITDISGFDPYECDLVLKDYS